MELFIVRPFGKKEVLKKDKSSGKEEKFLFDFDAVERELILPAIKALNIKGGTTGEIFEPGDIRQDMFSLLLMADTVIADISIHNANVFYELGIRHALRNKKTILLKCPGWDETPFDILGYRYVTYNKDAPADALPVLIKTLEETEKADRTDSPVFNMLPLLQTQDVERFLAVPPDFGEEVALAEKTKDIGKLCLLANEVAPFEWKIPALRSIGEAQFSLCDYNNARITCEIVQERFPEDFWSADRLATIYQRLAEEEMKLHPQLGLELLAKSDKAINWLLDHASIKPERRGEVYALKGRNAKMKWLNSWKNDEKETKYKNALQSPFLEEAFRAYENGYSEDLNHFYSGINALGLLTVLISLAERLPDVWEMEFDAVEEAETALKKYKDQHQKLTVMVGVAVAAKKRSAERAGKKDAWLNMTEADLFCLTATRPQRVESMYQKVIAEATDLNFDAAKRQLSLYQQLDILPENVQAALNAFKSAKVLELKMKKHHLLFTGHMIDKPGRKVPRFPPEKENNVRDAIKIAIQKETEKIEAPVVGIAGGACGSDILFHEVCAELGIETELYLALPPELFIVESVQFAGPKWIERFDALYKKLPVKILSNTKELPHWLKKGEPYTIWERNNLWMLYSSLIDGGNHLSLIALWDGKGGDGVGGTEHMVKVTREKGGKIIIIPSEEIIHAS